MLSKFLASQKEATIKEHTESMLALENPKLELLMQDIEAYQTKINNEECCLSISGFKNMSRPHVMINLYVDNLKGVIPLLRLIRKHEIKVSSYRNRAFGREYFFSSSHVDLTVRAMLKKNASCRQVQVGVKIVEEPVYEIQCDGD